MSANDIFKQSYLGLNLTPFTVRELFYLQACPCHIYIFEDEEFKILRRKGAYLESSTLKEFIRNGHITIFAEHESRKEIIKLQQENLRTITRSFSMGDVFENCKRQISLLTINMRYLYEDPINDETLNLQYQSLKILFRYLFKTPEHHEKIFKSYKAQGHHYIFAQPLLSSLFLLGILKQSHAYSEKDVESMFIASYFKDIGMSAIPVEKYNSKELSTSDKIIFSNHPKNSIDILKGRIPLSPNHIKMIEEHHSFSILKDELNDNISESLTVSGFETMLICTMDIVAAMTTGRPYQKTYTLFEALEHIKSRLSDQYPQEFKLIVNYFRNFFSNTVK